MAREIEVYEHQAGWGFIGITSGVFSGIVLVLALNLAQDPGQFLVWPKVLVTVGIELLVAIVLGWFFGLISAFAAYQAFEKTPEIYKAAAGNIFRTAVAILFVIASIYYWLTSRGQVNALPWIYWATGILVWLFSKKMGEILAMSLLR
ncbi:MAG: hypothetical protein SXV54_10360 [Chloroflexota bacterium]|nr:hypothetical protein [Chloroflexota bacterium]